MRKVSNVVSGTLLRNTSPAAIETVLLNKVRSDLGDFHDLAIIKPTLRIDQEDGDLSGNVTHGYGTVLVSVGDKTLHLPFIIHDKELLPFDVIRMGGQEVGYDLVKLRKLVVALDKHSKEQTGDDTVHGEVMEVADIRDVPTQNGFLGTIMNIRDSNSHLGSSGIDNYEGQNFGHMEDERLQKMASLDVAEVFEEFHEKLANIRTFTKDDVKAVVSGIEKKAEKEAEQLMETVSDVEVSNQETAGVQRAFAELDQDKLASHKLVASGNNIKFPIYEDGQFEYRNGRVYHKIKSTTDYPENDSKIKHIVVDNKNHYALLGSDDKFMVSVAQPSHFDFRQESARGLQLGHMYAFEWETDTISRPFFVNASFLQSEEDNGILVSVPERTKVYEVLKAAQSTIFRDAFECIENNRRFTVVILKGNESGKIIEEINSNELYDYINKYASDSSDFRVSRMIVERFRSEKIIFVSENMQFFKLKTNISGHFTKPDGLFKEGPLFDKTAAYDQANKVRLHINEQKRPSTYSVEWSFADEKDIDGETGYALEKKRMDDLSPAQAKQILQDLGFDYRKQEMFFQIAKRNGRFAEFALPNVEVAKGITPKDKAVSKAKDAVRNIANATLNAGNFIPVLENVMADTAAGAITSIVPSSVDWMQNLQNKVAQSQEVAMEFEKIADSVKGQAWSEIAYVLNMKHHLDKLASTIEGGFVKDAEPIFADIKQLEPLVEKIASDLIQFNREQLRGDVQTFVKPEMVKQALHELDGITGYIKVAEELEKKSFFHKGTRSKIDQLANTMIGLQKNNQKIVGKMKNQSVDMRVLDRKGLQDTEEAKKKAESFLQTQNQFTENTKKIGENAKEQEKLTQQIQNKNRAAMVGIGIPGLAGLSYGYQANKNK